MLKTQTRGPVTRIHLGRTVAGRVLRTVSAYLVDGLLIDTGPPAVAEELLRWLRTARVEQAFITHHHEDHGGGNTLLRQELGVPLWAAPSTAAILARMPRLQLYRRAVWGQPQSMKVEVVGPFLETAHYRFEVIPTPGHCEDHTCLFEPRQGWLFGGDLFIHERVRHLRTDEDLAQSFASLRRMRALSPGVLFCSHAGFVEEPRAAIGRKLAFWRELALAAQRLAASGIPERAITRQLLGREDLLTLISRGHFSKANLTQALLSLELESE